MSTGPPAVFLDLNGTLVEPVQPPSLAEMQILPGAAAAVSLLREAGYLTPVITTQSRIEKGLFSEAEFNNWFASTIVPAIPGLANVYVCPHRFGAGCRCQKPEIELFLHACEEIGIAISESCWVIGDTGADIEAAERLGIRCCLVRTGWGLLNEAEYGPRATRVVDNVLHAAEVIAEHGR